MAVARALNHGLKGRSSDFRFEHASAPSLPFGKVAGHFKAEAKA